MARDPYVCYRTKCRYNQGPGCKDGSCNYILVEGRSRIAQHEPGHRSPKECKCFKEGRRVKIPPEKPAMLTAKTEPKRLIPYHRIAAIDWDIALKLYKEGLSDGEIAVQIGCKKATVFSWRKRNNLPTMQKTGRRRAPHPPQAVPLPQGEGKKGCGEA